MRESVKDDFTDVLPVFAFSGKSGAQAATSKMSRDIEKGHKLIDKHSITAKPSRSPSGGDPAYKDFYSQREFNRWVDNAWMLIGKSHVYSRQWYEGIGAFERVLQIFPEKQIRFEAMLWIARIYIELGNFESARLQLERFASGIDDESSYRPEFNSTYASYWLAQDKYQEALAYCMKAAETASDRWEKIRWSFILGQVAEKTGNFEIAMNIYSQVARLNPDYAFSIHARIKSAMLNGVVQSRDAARQELIKYAKEYKNIEYRDYIYYALADTWLRDGDTLNALTNFKLAAGYGQGNSALSGNIYHSMADIYYKSGDYVAADAYYDSTLNVVPEYYEGINELKRLKKKMNPLAQNLKVVQHEDSVQRIAALSEPEREQFIDNLLVMMKEKEESSGFVDDTDDAFFYRNFANRGNQTIDEKGKWYFYNQNMVSLGQMEFEKRWGRRELEDDWRRADKEMQMARDDGNDGAMPTDPFDQSSDSGPVSPDSDKSEQADGLPDRESLLAGIPLSTDELQKSHLKVQTSLFNAAHMLMYNFEKYGEAKEMFERLLQDYPDTDFREQTLMGIFMACRAMKDDNCANHYGEVVTSDYPDSRFAEFINNPDFLQEREAYNREMETLYAQAYNAMKNQAWNSVMQDTEAIISKNHTPLMPQALLLNALAVSQTGDVSKFRNQLNQILDSYAASSQARVAQSWLQLLEEGREPERITEPEMLVEGGESDRTLDEEESDADDMPVSRFAMDFDSLHYVMIVMKTTTDINQLLFHLANFNFDRYTIGAFNLETRDMGSTHVVLETGPFENRQTGMDYFFALVNNPSVFKVENIEEPLVLLASGSNKEELNNISDIEDYTGFFLENYLPGSDRSAFVINESEIPEWSYMEEQIPEQSSIFSPNSGSVWGMIVLSGNGGDVSEAVSFLPNVSRSLLRYSVEVVQETLSDNSEVLMLKAFESMADFEAFKSSLDDNSYWNSRLAGEEWIICPVSTENFELLQEGEGDIDEYLQFLGL